MAPPLAVRVPHRERSGSVAIARARFIARTSIPQPERKGASSRFVWRYEHVFRDAEGGTPMRDRVQYELPFGILGNAVQKLIVACELERSCDYRARTLEEMSAGAVETA